MVYSSSQPPQNSVPSTTIIPPMPSNEAGFLAIVFVLSLVLVLLGYRKHRAAQRSRLLKRQIAMLEAMWRISSTK